MTNFEKYKDEILEIVRETESFAAIKDGVPVRCKDVGCDDCDLETRNCRASFFKWLYEDDGEQEFTCSSCKYADKREDESPCLECGRNYMDMFKLKPKKTRQSEFLKLFPNARREDGLVCVSPCNIEGEKYMGDHCDLYKRCVNCRKEYWLKEVGE